MPPKTNEVAILNLLQKKNISWDEVSTAVTTCKSISVGILRQALHKACLDRSVSSRAMKVLLKKTTTTTTKGGGYEESSYLSTLSESGLIILTSEERAKLLVSAIRCENRSFIQHMVESDVDILFWNDIYNNKNTVLHWACERFGWNAEISFVLDLILKHNNDNKINNNNKEFNHHHRHHEGLFQRNSLGLTPIGLSLDVGGDTILTEIVSYLQAHHRQYFESYMGHFPFLIAEYCDDMSLFKDLSSEFPSIVQLPDRSNNSTPLHHACYYQNHPMIRFLLTEAVFSPKSITRARKQRRKRNLLNQRLLMGSNNNDNMTPLGYLIMGLGSMDSGNAFDCVRICMEFCCVDDKGTNLPILHYTIDKLWDKLIARKTLQTTITRIVNHGLYDFGRSGLLKSSSSSSSSSVDQYKDKSLLVLMILKLAGGATTTSSDDDDNNANQDDDSEEIKALKYILAICGKDKDGTGLCYRRDNKNRLPLHIACENGLQFYGGGLECIVKANVSALEEIDPKFNLLPFAISASSPTSDLNTIYELLRYNPGVLNQLRYGPQSTSLSKDEL